MRKKALQTISYDILSAEITSVQPTAEVGDDANHFAGRLSGIALQLKQGRELVHVNTQRTVVHATKRFGKHEKGCRAHVLSCSQV
jgi:hypothetical protein